LDSLHFISSIRAHEEVAEGYFLLSLELPKSVRSPKPGEFFMVKVGRDNDPLLRRPLSLHRLITEDTFQIIYRVRGRGTRILSERKAGDKIDLIGPLGRGFEIPLYMDEAILVAGGIGIAPLFCLAEELRKRGKSVKLFIGGKNKKDILCERDLESLGLDLFISTEDGSHGKKGMITEILEDYLRVQVPKLKTQLYACGPKPMLKRVSGLAKANSLRCYVSLEERMACGIGACLGCAVKVRSRKERFTEYKMVCKDGPVFNAEEIEWDAES